MEVTKDQVLAEIKKIELKLKELKKHMGVFEFTDSSYIDELKKMENSKGYIFPEQLKILFGKDGSKIATAAGYLTSLVWCKEKRKTLRVYCKK